MPNFIALGQTMYEKSVTTVLHLQYFGAPGRLPVSYSKALLSNRQISSRSQKPSRKYLLPKFVEFVDDTDTLIKKTINYV